MYLPYKLMHQEMYLQCIVFSAEGFVLQSLVEKCSQGKCRDARQFLEVIGCFYYGSHTVHLYF